MSTSIFDAIDALETGFTTALATASPSSGQVQVNNGPVRDYNRESVWIMDLTTPSDQDWATLGHVKRKERYSLNASLVVGGGEQITFGTQRSRAETLFALIESWLRSNVDLGLSGSYQDIRAAILSNNLLQFPNPDDGSPVVQVDFTVGVEARI